MQIRETDNKDKPSEDRGQENVPTAFFGSIRGSEAHSEASQAVRKETITNYSINGPHDLSSNFEHTTEERLPQTKAIRKAPKSLNKITMIDRDKSRFQSMLNFGNKITLTRSSVK